MREREWKGEKMMERKGVTARERESERERERARVKGIEMEERKEGGEREREKKRKGRQIEVTLTPNLAPRLAPPYATDGSNTLVQNVEANLSSNRKQGGFRKTSCLEMELFGFQTGREVDRTRSCTEV